MKLQIWFFDIFENFNFLERFHVHSGKKYNKTVGTKKAFLNPEHVHVL